MLTHHSREIVALNYNHKVKSVQLQHRYNLLAPSQYIFDNQKEDAHIITNKFYNLRHLCAISIIKRTKVGMNGVMIEIAKNITTHNDEHFNLNYHNILFTTGMSNKDWETELTEQLPECFKFNVFHHGRFKQLAARLENISNALIIIDEIDVGDKEGQKLHQMLQNANLLNVEYIQHHNIRFVFVSATMSNELDCLEQWGDRHEHVTLTIPNTYIGHDDFKQFNLLKEFFPITNHQSARNWVNFDILQMYGRDDPRVHIIRSNSANVSYIKDVCDEYQIVFKNHTSIDRLSKCDLNDIFDNLNQHVVIVVKGLFRRANLIPNHWKLKIGAIHEYKSAKSQSQYHVQIQGLVGRMTGYWRNHLETGHKTGPFRTSLGAIIEYENWYLKNVQRTLNVREHLENCPLWMNVRNIGGLITNGRDDDNVVESRAIMPVLCKRVPVVIAISKKCCDQLCKKRGDNRKQIVMEIIKQHDYKLYNFAMKSYCKQITHPMSESSRNKHIEPLINKYNKGEPYSANVGKTEQNDNIWNCYIDSIENQLCIVIWSISFELY